MTQASARPEQSQGDAAPISERRGPRRILEVQDIRVDRIRPEDGLGRKRDRDGHRELRKSIEQFGVLTPITVRHAPDETGEYLLVKGQGRTLACEMLGIETIPAIVVSVDFAEDEKVQQFLVENVARLRMRPVDRALLISRARQDGEETVHVARRFGVSPVTVRRLQAQLNGATKSEVAALRSGNMNLALHAVISRHVDGNERADIVSEIAKHALRTREVDELFCALGWEQLAELGSHHRSTRLLLIAWACQELTAIDKGTMTDRISQLAERLPSSFAGAQQPKVVTVG
jgi:ParB/RepB/Spo0J family partition protein